MKYNPICLKETGYEKPEYVECLFTDYLFGEGRIRERAEAVLNQLEGLQIVEALDFLERCKQAVMQSIFHNE